MEISTDISEKLVQNEHLNGTSHIITPSPSYSSGETSPIPNEYEEEPATSSSQKKKKKKKPKKSAKAKEAAAAAAKANAEELEDLNRPPVLCISRNKHWRYISSYHVRNCIVFRVRS